MKKRIYLLLNLVIMINIVNVVHAEGFIAGLLKDAGVINEDQRRVLDGIHEDLRNPLDDTWNAAQDYYFPGFRQGVDLYNNLQKSSPTMSRGSAPMNRYQSSFQQQRLGNICQAGVISCIPGVAPIGTPCWCNTMYGPANGIIVR